MSPRTRFKIQLHTMLGSFAQTTFYQKFSLSLLLQKYNFDFILKGC